ncbi:MAG: DUF4956 domain-containing protein [Tenericutes bacterium HGW-Tenericutes-1]|nr:MAG: DUF4956 domain-containing protein [Tenericutes bacterium HGW-Tenericutes-1]
MILSPIMLAISDFLDQIQSMELSVTEVILNLVISFILSLWVLFIYKLSYQTTVYNKSFAMTLPVSALVTSMVIMAVASNIVLSLGMVGALSIVRFRTAIKNPLDTIFMFWTIGVGITVGANSWLLAVIGSIVIGLCILLVQSLELFTTPFIVIIRVSGEFNEDSLLSSMKDVYSKFQIRNKTILETKSEYTFEVRGQKDITKRINALKDLQGVDQVMLLSYRGDYVI